MRAVASVLGFDTSLNTHGFNMTQFSLRRIEIRHFASIAEAIGYNAVSVIIYEVELQRTVSVKKCRCRMALDRNSGHAPFDGHVELALAGLSKEKLDWQRVREVENFLLLGLQERQKQMQEVVQQSGMPAAADNARSLNHRRLLEILQMRHR